MAKKIFTVVVELDSDYLKLAIVEVSRNRLLSGMVKSLSHLKTKEERDNFIISTLKEAVPSDLLRQSEVMICLSGDYIQIKRINLPHMPLNEIPEALKWRVKGLVPFDVDKAVLDFDIVGESVAEDGAKKYDIIMAAVLKSIIDERVSLLQKAGLNVSGVNVDSFGLSNAVRLTPEGKKDKACAVLNIDYTKAVVNIYKDGKLVFTRNIPIGLNHIRDAIKSPILLESGPTEFTPEEIEKLKSVGIPDNKDLLLGGRLQGRHILALIRPVLETLSSEIDRSIDYYNTQLEEREISKIYIAGSGFNCSNLDIFIKDILGIETECLRLSKEGEAEDILPQIMPLIGTALGGVKGKVNLLPVEYKVEKMQRIEKISIRMAGFLALAILIASFILVNTRLNDYRLRLTRAKSHRKVLEEIKTLYDKISEREGLIDVVRSKEIPTTDIMKELSSIIPDNILLNNLAIDQERGVLNLEGVVYLGPSEIGEVVLTDFMEVMERSPFFKDINLESSKKGIIKDKKVAQFNISCALQR